VHLRRDDFTLRPLVKWHAYPIEWSVKIPSLSIDVTAKAVLPDQELRGTTNYWEGAVDYSGTHRGVGYLEMTGYYRPVHF
jgi:predicted secreted hydrolase